MATTSNAEFIVANLEFDDIKSNLKTYLSAQNIFQDYNFDGSNMSVLLDVLAYNTYYNAIHLNAVASEMFLDSAQIRDSVYSHAKQMNYMPTSRRSSVAHVDITVTPSDSPHTITVPRLTEFQTTVGDNVYTFSTNSSLVLNSGSSYTASNVDIYEGEVVNEFYLVANSQNTYYINNQDIDTSSLTVKVRTSNTDTTNTTWTRSNSLFGVTSTSNVFFIQAASNGSYEIVFGNDTFGRKLTDGNIVEASYRASNKDDSDGANSFTATGTVGGYSTVSTALITKATGGGDKQEVDDVKFAAPRALSVQERAVTVTDYETLVKNEFPDITALNVYGGEDADPPEFGKVIMVAKSNVYTTLPQSRKQAMVDFIGPKSSIAVEPRVIDAGTLSIKIDSSIVYNINATDSQANDIKVSVESAINTFSSDNLTDFKKTMRHSKLVEKINESDTAILSNETNATIYKTINPKLNAAYTKTIDFHNPLKQDNPISANTQGSYTGFSTPAVSSETFTFNSTTGASFRDDGTGTLQIVVANSSSLQVLEANAGSVSYGSGNVSITNVTINAITTGTTIKLYARSNTNDITTKNSDIVEIADGDVTVTINGVRE